MREQTNASQALAIQGDIPYQLQYSIIDRAVSLTTEAIFELCPSIGVVQPQILESTSRSSSYQLMQLVEHIDRGESTGHIMATTKTASDMKQTITSTIRPLLRDYIATNPSALLDSLSTMNDFLKSLQKGLIPTCQQLALVSLIYHVKVYLTASTTLKRAILGRQSTAHTTHSAAQDLASRQMAEKLAEVHARHEEHIEASKAAFDKTHIVFHMQKLSANVQKYKESQQLARGLKAKEEQEVEGRYNDILGEAKRKFDENMLAADGGDVEEELQGLKDAERMLGRCFRNEEGELNDLDMPGLAERRMTISPGPEDDEEWTSVGHW